MRYDLLNFTNISDEDFVGKWGGEEYIIKAGRTKAFPSFLVDHFTKHLVDRILLRKGSQNYTDPIARKPLEEQIRGNVVVEKETKAKIPEGKKVKEEVEEAQEEFADLESKRKKEIKEKKIEALKKARAAKAAKKE